MKYSTARELYFLVFRNVSSKYCYRIHFVFLDVFFFLPTVFLVVSTHKVWCFVLNVTILWEILCRMLLSLQPVEKILRFLLVSLPTAYSSLKCLLISCAHLIPASASRNDPFITVLSKLMVYLVLTK